MGNLSLQELLVIAFIALLVFGPDRLPEIARQAGKFIGRLRSETSKSVAELKRAADIEELDKELKAIRSDMRSIGRDLSGLGDETPSTGAARASDGTPVVRRDPPPIDHEAT